MASFAHRAAVVAGQRQDDADDEDAPGIVQQHYKDLIDSMFRD